MHSQMDAIMVWAGDALVLAHARKWTSSWFGHACFGHECTVEHGWHADTKGPGRLASPEQTNYCERNIKRIRKLKIEWKLSLESKS